MINARTMLAAGLAAAAMLSGCASATEVTAESAEREAAPEETTSSTAAPTTAAPTTAAPTTAAPTTAAPTTAAPAAEPESLSWSPPDGTPGPQMFTLDTYDVKAGDMVTATVSGFAPNVSLGSGFVGVWPPSGVPDEDHLPSYIPAVATTDASGNATIEIEIHEVCGKGDCYLSIADGIGFNAWYAARQLNYVG